MSLEGRQTRKRVDKGTYTLRSGRDARRRGDSRKEAQGERHGGMSELPVLRTPLRDTYRGLLGGGVRRGDGELLEVENIGFGTRCGLKTCPCCVPNG